MPFRRRSNDDDGQCNDGDVDDNDDGDDNDVDDPNDDFHLPDHLPQFLWRRHLKRWGEMIFWIVKNLFHLE